VAKHQSLSKVSHPRFALAASAGQQHASQQRHAAGQLFVHLRLQSVTLAPNMPAQQVYASTSPPSRARRCDRALMHGSRHCDATENKGTTHKYRQTHTQHTHTHTVNVC
jgi:hypothetical protein